MDLRFTPEEDAFRKEVRAYLDDLLHGEFAVDPGPRAARATSTPSSTSAWPGSAASAPTAGRAWAGPTEFGGRGLPLNQQVIYFEEYARAGGPGRLGHIGEGLIGPTIIHFGIARAAGALPARHPPGPGAVVPGLLRARRRLRPGQHRRPGPCCHRLDGDEWVIDGQKVWTSLAHWSDWCFVLARTDRDAPKHKGISFLLIRMDAPGIEIRPIVQLTGTSEFNEVFFAGARTPADLVVGGVNEGWKVAMGLLSFERGASTLGQQFALRARAARDHRRWPAANGRARDPGLPPAPGRRPGAGWRSCAGTACACSPTPTSPSSAGRPTSPSSTGRGSTATWASCFLDALGADGLVGRRPTDPLRAEPRRQRLFLYTRADTIYGGSNQIQRNIIGERALGLPRRAPPDLTVDLTTRPTPPTPDARGDHRAHRPSLRRGPPPARGSHRGGHRRGRHRHRLGGGPALRRGGRHRGHQRRPRAPPGRGGRVELSELAGRPVLGVRCNVTVQADIDRLFATAIDELGHIDVLVNNAGLGGTAEVVDMTDEQWNLVLDVTLTGTFRATRAALGHMLPSRVGRDREQRLGAGLAGPGRPGPLRGGQGRGHGPDPLHRHRGGAVGRAGERGGAQPGHAPVPGQGHLRRPARRAHHPGGVRPAAEPWEVANVIVFLASDYSSYLTGEVVSVSSQHA